MKRTLLIPIAILALLVIIAIVLLTPMQPVTHALSIASACDPDTAPIELASVPLVLATLGTLVLVGVVVGWSAKRPT
jgi:hypothetical protein